VKEPQCNAAVRPKFRAVSNHLIPINRLAPWSEPLQISRNPAAGGGSRGARRGGGAAAGGEPQGSVASSRCATARPLHTRLASRIGSSVLGISVPERTTRPNSTRWPRSCCRRGRARRTRSAWRRTVRLI
jgi:hypothetical protein